MVLSLALSLSQSMACKTQQILGDRDAFGGCARQCSQLLLERDDGLLVISQLGARARQLLLELLGVAGCVGAHFWAASRKRDIRES